MIWNNNTTDDLEQKLSQTQIMNKADLLTDITVAIGELKYRFISLAEKVTRLESLSDHVTTSKQDIIYVNKEIVEINEKIETLDRAIKSIREQNLEEHRNWLAKLAISAAAVIIALISTLFWIIVNPPPIIVNTLQSVGM